MKKLWLIGLVALAACGPTEEERRATFMRKCVPAYESTSKCDVLWDVKKSSDDARDMALFAVGMSAASSSSAIAASAARK